MKRASIALFGDGTQAMRITKALLLNTIVDASRPPSLGVATTPAPTRCGPFVYSPTTLRLVRDGSATTNSTMMRFLSSLAARDIWEADAMDDASACAVLTERFVLLLTTISELLSVMGENTLVIDGLTGFATPVDALIRDQLDVPPRALGAFSESLHRDVRLSLAQGGNVRFSWGQLALVDHKMTVVVDRKPSEAPRLGKRVLGVG